MIYMLVEFNINNYEVVPSFSEGLDEAWVAKAQSLKARLFRVYSDGSVEEYMRPTEFDWYLCNVERKDD